MHAESCGDPLCHEVRVYQRGQVHERQRVIGAYKVPDSLERQARLAAAAGTGKRHQASTAQQAPHLRDLTLATDEGTEAHGQLAYQRGPHRRAY